LYRWCKPALQSENIEEVNRKWNNNNKLTYAISNLTQKLTEESINEQIDSASF